LYFSPICTAHKFVLLTNYYLGEQIKEYEMGGACNTYGEKRNAYMVSVGKLEGKRPLGRPKCRCEDTEMDLKETV